MCIQIIKKFCCVVLLKFAFLCIVTLFFWYFIGNSLVLSLILEFFENPVAALLDIWILGDFIGWQPRASLAGE